MNNKYFVWVQYGLYIIMSIVDVMIINFFYAALTPLKLSAAFLFSSMMIIIAGLGIASYIFFKMMMIKLFGEEARI